MTRPLHGLVLAAVLALQAAGRARAEFVDFGYYWLPVDSLVGGSGHTIVVVKADDARPDFPGGAAGPVGSPLPLRPVYFGSEPSDGNSSPRPPERVDGTVGFTFVVVGDGGRTGVATFTGAVSGVLGDDTSTVRMTFPDRPPAVRVGAWEYQLDLPTAILPPRSGTGRDFTPTITIRPAETPEPSALLLAGVAAVAGLASRLRRSRAASRVGHGS